jgi:cytochrome bd-type quinol oxidase subunit 2
MTLFFILWLGCAIFCWVVANSKGRFAGVWFLLGLVFGIFALIAVAALPSVLPPKDAPNPKTHVKCPDCRELVLKDANVCRHCHCKLIPQKA